MLQDPIVEEVRKVREAYAAQFDFDLDRIFRALKALEEQSGEETVSLPPRRPEPASPVRPPRASA